MKVIPFIIILLLLSSCRKDKFKGEAAVLVGKWQWEYTAVHYVNYYTPSSSFDTIYASEYSNTFQIEFEKAGYVIYKKDHIIEKKYRSVFEKLEFENCTSSLCDYAVIRPNNNHETKIFITKPINNYCSISNVNLPLPQSTSGSVSRTYTHYYKKQ